MLKGGKLRKLLKKMKSLGGRQQSSSNRSRRSMGTATSRSSVRSADVSSASPSSSSGGIEQLHAVYVGKSRRRYLIRTEVIHHPVFRELAMRDVDDSGDAITVCCEVVLFDHLLWMIDNDESDNENSGWSSDLQELVELYAT